MYDIQHAVEERRKLLIKVINENKRILKGMPEGSLRVNGKNFYHRRNDEDKNGVYIRRKNDALVRRLAAKDFAVQVYELAAAEYDALSSGKLYTGERFEEIYERLSMVRQGLIETDYVSDELYAKRWQEAEYMPPGCRTPGFRDGDPEFYTDRGERVRSKSEIIIANLLNRYDIPYRYECPVFMEDGTPRFPDFTILIRSTRRLKYWEHLGLIDDPKYRKYNIFKLNEYAMAGILPGINLITTMETPDCPLDVRATEQIVMGLRDW